MIGIRQANFDYTQSDLWAWPAGSYGKMSRADSPLNGVWFCRTPNGHSGNLKAHDVIEHEDGTITVSPSILVSNNVGQLWHGYLRRGVWEEC